MQFKHILDLDFETWSPTDIKTAGAYKYAEKAEILLMSYSIDEGPVKDVDVYHNGFPENIKKLFTDPKYLKRAQNAAFERCIIYNVLGIYSPPEQWECIMIKGAMAGLPLSLDAMSKALGLSEKKDWTGSALIRYFCIPCKPTKANGERTRNLPEHDMVKWKQFMGYCNQDVVTQIAIAKELKWFKIPAIEQKLWCMDQRCNERGVAVDLALIKNAMELDEVFRDGLLKEAIEITGLRNANSVAQLKKWLSEEMDEEVKSLSKGSVVKLLDKVESDKAKRVLELRSLLAKSSIKKYQAMLNAAGHDGRIRGMFQFYGAGRTGRDAGRLAQPQNFPRIHMSEDMLAMARELALSKDTDMIDLCFGNLSDVLSQLTRTTFIPAKNNKFIVSDFSAIEMRTLSWLAGEEWVLKVFKGHGKIYEATASQMFKVPIEQVTKGSELRQKAKIASLALQYQGAVNALLAMGALEMGLTEEELKPLVDAWRAANPNIVQFWWAMEKAAKNCLRTGGVYAVGDKGIRFEYRAKNLLMHLPSGRFLCYHGAHLKEVWSLKGKILGYTAKPCKLGRFVISDALLNWANQFELDETGKYIETDKAILETVKHDNYGDVSVNEIINLQSIQRRELLLFWASNQTTKQWELTSTYAGKLAENANQAIARDCLMQAWINTNEAGYFTVMRVHDELVSDGNAGSIKEFNDLMIKPAAWMRGLPLKAEGFEGMYYQK